MEYMSIAYSPKDNKGRSSVEHLCTADSTFTAPTTFPTCKSPMDYADSHSKVMACVADLEIHSYDIVFAKDSHVLLRYSAGGSHCGEPVCNASYALGSLMADRDSSSAQRDRSLWP